MKLKYNNFLIIVPVFLILGVVLSIFNYTLEKNELMWGVESELESITKATAIFIKNSKDSKKTEESIKKIIEYNRVKSMILIENSRVVVDVKADGFDMDIKHYDIREFEPNKMGKSEIYSYKDLHLIDGYIKLDILNSSLIVTMDVTKLIKTLQHEYIEAIITTMIITFIGILVSILLSIIVTYKINEVSMMAKALSSGKYDIDFNFGRVKEFSDLGATLDIMKSILREILFKTRNTIMQEELFSKDNLLVGFYNKSVNKKSHLESEDIYITIKSLGDGSSGFYHCFEDDKFIYSYFGTIETISDIMTSTITSCSLSYYIRNIIEQKHKVDLETLSDEYDIKSLTIAKVDKSSAMVDIKRLNAKDSIIDLNDCEIHILHSSHIEDTQSLKKVKSYISKYPTLSISQIADDVSILFEEDDIFMLISKDYVSR